MARKVSVDNKEGRLGASTVGDLIQRTEGPWTIVYGWPIDIHQTWKERGHKPYSGTVEALVPSVRDLRELLWSGDDVNGAIDAQDTRLTLACSLGLNGWVNDLLVGGASPNVAGPSGLLPLVRALEPESTEVLETLLQHGASVDQPMAFGVTTLVMAALAGREAHLKLLLAHGADPNVTVAGFAALSAAASEGMVKCAETLIEAGALIEAADDDGWTPLLVAVYRRKEEVVRFLLSKGADVRRTPRKGNTALGLALQLGEGAIAKEIHKVDQFVTLRELLDCFVDPKTGREIEFFEPICYELLLDLIKQHIDKLAELADIVPEGRFAFEAAVREIITRANARPKSPPPTEFDPWDDLTKVPETVPLYLDREDKAETPLAFLERVWKKYIDAGVALQGDITARDPKLVPNVRSYCQRMKLNPSDHLPPKGKAELVELSPEQRLDRIRAQQRAAIARSHAKRPSTRRGREELRKTPS